MRIQFCVRIIFFVFLFGAITAFPAPVKDEVNDNHLSVSREQSSTSATQDKPYTTESSIESNESKSDVSSEELSVDKHDENKDKPESGKNIKVNNIHSSKNDTPLKLNAGDKTRAGNRIIASKVDGGQLLAMPHQDDNESHRRLAVSSSKQSGHYIITGDDDSSSEESRIPRHKHRPTPTTQMPRRNGPIPAGRQQMSNGYPPVTAPPFRGPAITLLEKIMKQQFVMQQILKQMLVRQSGMEASLFHVAKNFGTQQTAADYPE